MPPATLPGLHLPLCETTRLDFGQHPIVKWQGHSSVSSTCTFRATWGICRRVNCPPRAQHSIGIYQHQGKGHFKMQIHKCQEICILEHECIQWSQVVNINLLVLRAHWQVGGLCLRTKTSTIKIWVTLSHLPTLGQQMRNASFNLRSGSDHGKYLSGFDRKNIKVFPWKKKNFTQSGYSLVFVTRPGWNQNH